MDPLPIQIPLDQPDANVNQFESLKHMSDYFRIASVPTTEWSGHLKRLYDFYEAIYSCIDLVSRGQNVFAQVLDGTDDRIEIQSLIKSYSVNIVSYATTRNQNAREIAEAFCIDDRVWVELQCTDDAAADIGY